MKAKEFGLTWLWTGILMYFLYDIVWILVDYEEFNSLIEDGCTILWIDLCYCFLFALYNLGFGTILLRSRFIHFFQKKKVLVFCAILLIANTFLAFLVENILDVLFVELSKREVWGNAYLMGLISSMQALIIAVEYYYKESQQKYEENRRLEMQLLKSQMNPHFVFNSLSVLAGLIGIDAKRAENYVIRLSRIYRHILGHIESDVVSLDEAFLWLDDYMALLQLRYENIALVMKPMETHPDDCILSQSLQVLSENLSIVYVFGLKKPISSLGSVSLGNANPQKSIRGIGAANILKSPCRLPVFPSFFSFHPILVCKVATIPSISFCYCRLNRVHFCLVFLIPSREKSLLLSFVPSVLPFFLPPSENIVPAFVLKK